MQSAVADSSSDTGLHEEWSGLSFQNTELSTGNQPSNILDSEKQQGSWADNNLQTASSFSSKPFPMLNDSSVNSSFPGFQQPGIQYKPEQRESLLQDEPHESIQNSPKSNSEWLDRNPRQQLSAERCQQVQHTLEHLDNTWVSHRNERSESDAPLPRIDPYSIVCQPSSKQEGDINEAMYKRNSDGGLWKRDGDTRNSYGRDGKTYDQQNCYLKDNSYDCKPVDISATACRPVGPSGINVTAGTSQNMLELLNKVDRLKENTSVAQFDSSGFNPLSEMTDAKPPAASVDQMYNQSSASQGYSLKLAPPSQRQSNSNSQFSSQGLLQPARQMDPDLGEKNQAWLATSPSSQSLPRSHESSPRARWEDKFSIGGQSSISQSYMHGSSIAEITSSPTFRRNQLQTQVMFNPPASGPSTQAALPATTTGHPPSNLARSQDAAQPTFVNPDGQQFPILESVPVSHPPFMSGMPPQGGVSLRSHSY
ncbi:hypothetical protein M0R45_033282 [Rubus argutus]|uniref:Uncharacterized protein n=1 Tax=Rubus argutus TaxID=59490 RepID=A0AAW1WMH1_RUBAR